MANNLYRKATYEYPTVHRRRLPYDFQREDSVQAIKEGWILSERDDGFLEIQRHDESAQFTSDIQAQHFVRSKAASENVRGIHRRAWSYHATRWLKEAAVPELEEIDKEAARAAQG